VAIIGAGMTKFGQLFDLSFFDLIAEAYLAALRSVDETLDPHDIKAGWLSTVMKNPIHGSALTQATGLKGIAVTRVENMCPSGSDAFRNAVFSVASGAFDLALVVGAEKMSEPDFEAGGRAALGWPHPIADFGLSAPGFLGLYGTRHMHEFGTTKIQMAHVTVNNRQHSTLNPYAYFRTPVTVEDVLNSPVVCEPFNLLDCCPENDGAAAVIIASEDLAGRYSRHPVWVEGLGMATDTQSMGDKISLTELLPAKLAARECYEMAGIGPDELDVVELHDCFSITQIILCEDLGLCDKGKGGSYIEQGNGKIGTKIAINPSGGLMGRGHPLGATGLAQICELYWQIRGEAGERQQPNAGMGLQINVGGSAFSTSCATILRG
jgi:acetyl-CoA C-acetyltransferase